MAGVLKIKVDGQWVELPRGAPGPAGPPGADGSGSFELEAGENINLAEVVRVSSDGKAWRASSSTVEGLWRVVGVARTNATTGEQVEVIQTGVLETGTAFPVGPLFLNVDGSLTDNPSTGIAQLHVADAVLSTLLSIRVEPAIYL